MDIKTRNPSGRSRRASAMVEFALWLPLLLMFVGAVVDWGWYMTTRVAVARAVMDGTRIGAATFEPRSSAPGSTSVPRATARTLDVMSGLGVACGAGCNVTAQWCATGQGGICQNPPFQAITVRARYAYTPFFGFVPTPTMIDEQFLMAMESQRPGL